MCYQSPIRVKCAVSIGIFVKVTKQNVAPMMLTRDTKKWPKQQFDTYRAVYGDEDLLQLLWDQHINFCKDAMNNCGDGVFLVEPEHLSQSILFHLMY